MNGEACVHALNASQEFFQRSTACLTEEDASFAPAEGMMTTAQAVAHTAHTIEWFVAGAFHPEGFDMDFESHAEGIAKITSLAEARAWLERAYDQARETFGAKSVEELTAPLPEGPVMGGQPRFAVVSGIEEHTAHHRGALTVYSRLRGHTPAMPYMDM